MPVIFVKTPYQLQPERTDAAEMVPYVPYSNTKFSTLLMFVFGDNRLGQQASTTMTSALLSTFSCCEAFLCLDVTTATTSDSADSILAHHRGEDETAQSSSYKPKPMMERQSPSQRKTTTTSLMDETTTTNNETTTTGQGDPTEDMDDDSNNNENNSIDNLDDALANMGTYIVE